MTDTGTQSMSRSAFTGIYTFLLAAGSLLGCVWFLLADKGLISITAFPGRIIAVYQLPAIGLAALCLFLICSYFIFVRRTAGGADKRGSATALVIIPFLILLCLLIAARSQTIAGLLFLFGVPLAWTWVLLPRTDPLTETASGSAVRRDGLLLLILFTMFYMLVGMYFTRSAGAHAGDEGHYLIQAHSLFHDGDLDLRNNIKSAGKLDHQRMHISPFSRDNAGYSWHPPGLSFMLALVWPLGIAGHHFMLGLFSGLAMAGTYMLARQMGAGRRDAWMVVMLLGFGTFWGVYSSRALPEVLGAALTVWGYYLCGWQRDRPVHAIAGTAFCIGALPWVHTRFLPVALLIMALFSWRIITGPQRSHQKAVQLVVFAAACSLVLGLYRLHQLQMFTGGQCLCRRGSAVRQSFRHVACARQQERHSFFASGFLLSGCRGVIPLKQTGAGMVAV